MPRLSTFVLSFTALFALRLARNVHLQKQDLNNTLEVRHGLIQLVAVSSGKPQLDIIAVHGLDGDWNSSWRTNEGRGPLWLQDFLPIEIPESRVFSWAYDSRTEGQKLSNEFMHSHGLSLLRDLTDLREETETSDFKTGDVPIIFISHSLGGLIVRSALLQSKEAANKNSQNLRRKKEAEEHSIVLSTYGLVFFGTPFRGAPNMSLKEIRDAVVSIGRPTSNRLYKHLEVNSEWLDEQQHRFSNINQDFSTLFCYEDLDTAILSFKKRIVPKDSATLPNLADSKELVIHADHTEMNKFSDAKNDDLVRIMRILKQMARNSPGIVEQNWRQWKRSVEDFTDRSQFRLQPHIAGLDVQDFIGRQAELYKLRVMLTSGRDRVIIMGLGGVGKTYLAKEYIRQTRSIYSSAFWIDSAKEQTLRRSVYSALLEIKTDYERRNLHESSIYTMISKAVLQYTAVKRTKDETPLGQFKKGSSPGSVPSNSKDDGQDYLLKAFHAWLKSSSDSSEPWLLVFDNFHHKQNERESRYIPTFPGGHIIFTSSQKHISYPNVIELYPMSEAEAFELLQDKMDSKTISDSSVPPAKELVETLGYLPLAIQVAGSYIGYSSYIPEYLQRYRSDPGILFENLEGFAGEESVARTFEISFLGLHKRTAELLQVCFFLSKDDIWPDLLRLGLGVQKSDDYIHSSLRRLEALSLVQGASKADGSVTYSIHPVVQMWGRYRLRDQKLRNLWSRKAIRLLDQALKTPDHIDAIDFYRRSIPHLNELVENRSSVRHDQGTQKYCIVFIPPLGHLKPGEVCHVLHIPSSNETALHNIQSTFSDWVLWLSVAIEESWRLLRGFLVGNDCDHDDNASLWCLYKSVQVYRDRELYREAKDLYLIVVLAIWKHYPIKHPRSLEVLGDYAWSLLQVESRYGQFPNRNFCNPGCTAAYLYSWLVVARAQVLGKNNPATAGALMGLARISMKKGDYAEALPLSHQAYETRLKAKGPEDRLTLNAKHLLFDALRANELWEDARLLRDQPSSSRHQNEFQDDYSLVADSLYENYLYSEATNWYQHGLGAELVEAARLRSASGKLVHQLYYEAYWLRTKSCGDYIGKHMAELRGDQDALREFYLERKRDESFSTLEMKPENVENLAFEFFYHEEWEDAKFWFTEMLSVALEDGVSWTHDVYRDMAWICENLNQADEAMWWYNYGLSMEKWARPSESLLWRNHLGIARILWNHQDFDGALDQLYWALDSSMYDSDIQSWMGVTFQQVEPYLQWLEQESRHFDVTVTLRRYLVLQQLKLEANPLSTADEVFIVHEKLANVLRSMCREDLALFELSKASTILDLSCGSECPQTIYAVTHIVMSMLEREDIQSCQNDVPEFAMGGYQTYYRRLMDWSYRSSSWPKWLYDHMVVLGTEFENHMLCEHASSIYNEAIRIKSAIMDEEYYYICFKYGAFLLMHHGDTEEAREWLTKGLESVKSLNVYAHKYWHEFFERSNNSVCGAMDPINLYFHFSCPFSSF